MNKGLVEVPKVVFKVYRNVKVIISRQICNRMMSFKIQKSVIILINLCRLANFRIYKKGIRIYVMNYRLNKIMFLYLINHLPFFKILKDKLLQLVDQMIKFKKMKWIFNKH